jgi:hypothetical protein
LKSDRQWSSIDWTMIHWGKSCSKSSLSAHVPRTPGRHGRDLEVVGCTLFEASMIHRSARLGGAILARNRRRPHLRDTCGPCLLGSDGLLSPASRVPSTLSGKVPLGSRQVAIPFSKQRPSDVILQEDTLSRYHF